MVRLGVLRRVVLLLVLRLLWLLPRLRRVGRLGLALTLRLALALALRLERRLLEPRLAARLLRVLRLRGPVPRLRSLLRSLLRSWLVLRRLLARVSPLLPRTRLLRRA